MKTIQLSRNMMAIVDDEFYKLASRYKWYCNVIHEIPYAVRNERVNAFKMNKILLHRAAYEYAYGKLQPKAHIRFINGNTLDCRVKNLILASKANNVDDKELPSTKAVK